MEFQFAKEKDLREILSRTHILKLVQHLLKHIKKKYENRSLKTSLPQKNILNSYPNTKIFDQI